MSVHVRTSTCWVSVPNRTVSRYLRGSEFVFGYDQIRTPKHSVRLLDLAAPAFLDDVPNFRRLRAIGERQIVNQLAQASAILKRIPANVDLWDWPGDQRNRALLADLFRACRFDGYSAASFTKMLHLKRPGLIPVLDSRVVRVWHGEKRWTFEELADVAFAFGDELRRRPATRASLRAVAGALGPPWSQLTTLRLYDIVTYWVL